MQKLQIFSLITVCLLTGCTQSQRLDKPPGNALFCDNITENIQTLQQLHLTPASSPAHAAAVELPAQPVGMWFTAMDYAEILMDKSQAEFTQAVHKRFAAAKALGVNTIFLQVRSHADAYYASQCYAPGQYLSTDCDFDPLEIMLTEAHGLSLAVHAWINPLRCQTTAGMEQMPQEYRIGQWYADEQYRGRYLVECGNYWWLNPAYPEVRELIADGVTELVEQYDLEGIHIDDYFYPTIDTAFDAAAFAESGAENQAAWRKEQCNAMVREMYQAVKAADASVVFGISPQGTEKGNAQQFADIDTWCTEDGYCDYIVPQLYYGMENTAAPFREMVDFWEEKVTAAEVALWIGICTYKVGEEDKWAGEGNLEWIENPYVPAEEVAWIREEAEVDGIAIYDYASTFEPEAEKAEVMAEIRKKIEAS